MNDEKTVLEIKTEIIKLISIYSADAAVSNQMTLTGGIAALREILAFIIGTEVAGDIVDAIWAAAKDGVAQTEEFLRDLDIEGNMH